MDVKKGRGLDPFDNNGQQIDNTYYCDFLRIVQKYNMKRLFHFENIDADEEYDLV